MGLPLHPAVVHLPLGVAAIMPAVFAVLSIAVARGVVGRRAFHLGAGVQAIALLGAFVAMASGNADEDVVKRVVAESLIERHEQLATMFLASLGATLALALATALAKDRFTRALSIVTTLASIGALAIGLTVGHAGGRLVYEHGAAAAHGAPNRPAAAPANREHDKD